MSAQILLFDRVEFLTVKIEANKGEFPLDSSFPQLEIDTEKFELLTRSDLVYPDDQANDPRLFMLTYGLKISKGEIGDQRRVPYDIEIEATGYFRYIGGEEFKEERRFRAVRFSGYQILYGAIREMVSNVTARSRHGLWHLPARTFNAIAEARAIEDETERKKIVAEAIDDLAKNAAAAQKKKKPQRRTATKSKD